MPKSPPSSSRHGKYSIAGIIEIVSYQKQRKKLVNTYIKPQVKDRRIIKAFLTTPRHKFLPTEFRDKAYLDIALPIDKGQTISQPSLVALMSELLNLKGNEKVLEVGTGSGYQAAILSHLVKDLYTVEIIPQLARKAQRVLAEVGIKNVHVKIADGTLGLPDYAPYDAIIVTAGAKKIPKALVDQLKESGRMVIPVGELGDQTLLVGTKRKGVLITQEIEPVRFVPLTGKHGWTKQS